MSGINLASASIKQLLSSEGFDCDCGKHHSTTIKRVDIGEDVVNTLPDILSGEGINHPLVISDTSTYEAAGRAVCNILCGSGIQHDSYVLPLQRPEPNEYSVGAVMLRHNSKQDGIIAVGSGTINDICKIVSNASGLPYIIVATAPSMDGYASDNSSMLIEGVKVTVPSKSPDIIILDTSIMAAAPERMLQAGLGDMLAKYVSICEWRISNCISDEYYCPEVVDLVQSALEKCLKSAPLLAKRNKEAVGFMAYGLVLSGIAMSFAGVSRPASGIEHYFSHIWEMTSIEKHLPHDLHGIQVGIGTLLALEVYGIIKEIKPNCQKALNTVTEFNMDVWQQETKRIFGTVAPAIIEQELRDGKYNLDMHKARLEKIIANWDIIIKIIDEELPTYDEILSVMKLLGAPTSPSDIDVSKQLLKDSFYAGKDIRDKYIASRLLWDIGCLDEAAEILLHNTSG